MRNRRRDKNNSLRQRVLILCEGAKTEPNYFNGLKHDAAKRRTLSAVDIEVYQPKSHSPLGLVREAIFKKKKALTKGNPYETIWLVFDRDYHKHIEEVIILAGKNDIKVIISNICFELWFLLHYEMVDVNKRYLKCGNLIKYIQQNYVSRYHKNAKNYHELKPLTDLAIERAKKLEEHFISGVKSNTKFHEREPYTNVYVLVEYLLDL
ncbi:MULTISPECIES: RloB family protein [Flammeovirga]|uniref:RloB domain-containing protein n=1 Tax=Flammeovirga agarivorans TaxID=2726742 RepID=A0A7X8SR26_9BACT|nr:MULTISPECIES: RloB family protein [Flammeovirga]NLR94810.1 RloB domain-containing protein [Flammeovirga agarivorans]